MNLGFLFDITAEEKETTVMEWINEKAPSCVLLVPPQMVWRKSGLFSKGWDLGRTPFPLFFPWHFPTSGLQHNSVSWMLDGQRHFTKLCVNHEAGTLQVYHTFSLLDLGPHSDWAVASSFLSLLFTTCLIGHLTWAFGDTLDFLVRLNPLIRAGMVVP